MCWSITCTQTQASKFTNTNTETETSAAVDWKAFLSCSTRNTITRLRQPLAVHFFDPLHKSFKSVSASYSNSIYFDGFHVHLGLFWLFRLQFSIFWVAAGISTRELVRSIVLVGESRYWSSLAVDFLIDNEQWVTASVAVTDSFTTVSLD